MNAVVLSGGGAKGSYQVGVWKALRKLNYKYDIVTGTSIGSINGALMVEKSYKKAYKLWNKLDFEFVFDNITCPEDLIRNSLKGGIEPTKIENLIRENLNIKKFRKSKINFGLVTVKFPKLTPVLLQKDEMSDDRLVDYIMASSTCFPVFAMKEIDNELYIDGAYHDNMPVNLAIDMGATKIVAVDLKAMGLKVKPKKDIEIINIFPKKKLGSFIDFGQAYNKINISYGYNDTMKAFNKLEGNIYYFKKNTIKKNHKKINQKYYQTITKIIHSKRKGIIKEIFKNTLYKDILTKERITEHKILEIMELTAALYDIDDKKVYNRCQFNYKIKQQIKSDKKNKTNIASRKIVIEIYNLLKENKHSKELFKYINLFKRELLIAIYIYSI